MDSEIWVTYVGLQNKEKVREMNLLVNWLLDRESIGKVGKISTILDRCFMLVYWLARWWIGRQIYDEGMYRLEEKMAGRKEERKEGRKEGRRKLQLPSI